MAQRDTTELGDYLTNGKAVTLRIYKDPPCLNLEWVSARYSCVRCENCAYITKATITGIFFADKETRGNSYRLEILLAHSYYPRGLI
jgi:hypothetical protein